MNNNIVNEITAKQIREDIPQFSSGDTVKVYYRIVENKKERIQVYEGVVIQRRGHGVSETFVVRKMSSGVAWTQRQIRPYQARQSPKGCRSQVNLKK